jgi:uncharacterized SAM-binding protein YcdF (DUF218 family)
VSLERGPVPTGRPEAARVRTPAWLAVASGAALALGTIEVALTLGLADATIGRHAWWRLGALVAGAVLGRTRAAWTLWPPAIAVTLGYLLVAYTPLVERPALALLRADAEGPPAEAVVVYSAAMTDAGDIGDIALTRLVSALDDVQRLGIPHLVLSEQVRTVRGRTISSAADQRRVATLLGRGVEVHVVRDVTNTHNESLAFAALARTRGWQRVRAVTSPLHTRRACAALEATGLDVTCAPAASRDIALTRLGTSGTRLLVARAAIHEFVGLLVYRLRGWL